MVLVLANFCPVHNMSSFLSMDETLDVQLLPWFAISNSVLKGNSMKKNPTFYWNLIKLYSTQNRCGHVCPIHNVTACKLLVKSAIWDSLPIIVYIPPNWSIKCKKFGSGQVCCMSNYYIVSHMQHFVPYATVCLCSLYTEQLINYFGHKLTFFVQI